MAVKNNTNERLIRLEERLKNFFDDFANYKENEKTYGEKLEARIKDLENLKYKMIMWGVMAILAGSGLGAGALKFIGGLIK